MRQRVLIAMAIAFGPKILIADEPTTALDVTVQAQILELLEELKADLGMGMVLISHDLGLVATHADRVAVMYAGRVVETSPVSRGVRAVEAPLHAFALPQHPPAGHGAGEPAERHRGSAPRPRPAAGGLCLRAALFPRAGP